VNNLHPVPEACYSYISLHSKNER